MQSCHTPICEYAAERVALAISDDTASDAAALLFVLLIYDRGYTGRQWSPGPEVTSLGEVRFSVTANRGCFGSCVFCAIGMHQGQIVQRRSADSILKEARMMTKLPAFKGYIHDVGGPTANFLRPGL